MSKERSDAAKRPVDRKVRVRFLGSMPAPKKEHGEEMLGGVILGREWKFKQWEYRVQHPSGNVLYHRAP